MPELVIIGAGLIASGGMVFLALFLKHLKNPIPELPESEIHKRRFIITGDEEELSKMRKALEREGG